LSSVRYSWTPTPVPTVGGSDFRTSYCTVTSKSPLSRAFQWMPTACFGALPSANRMRRPPSSALMKSAQRGPVKAKRLLSKLLPWKSCEYSSAWTGESNQPRAARMKPVRASQDIRSWSVRSIAHELLCRDGEFHQPHIDRDVGRPDRIGRETND